MEAMSDQLVLVIHLDRDNAPDTYKNKWNDMLSIFGYMNSIEYLIMCSKIIIECRTKGYYIELLNKQEGGFIGSKNECIRFFKCYRDHTNHYLYQGDELVMKIHGPGFTFDNLKILLKAMITVLNEHINNGLPGVGNCISGRLQYEL